MTRSAGPRIPDPGVVPRWARYCRIEKVFQAMGEDLVEAVADALRRDALTSDLAITVLVRGGVVYLRGEVPSVDDAAAAEAIAGDVPGVVEIREELRTTGGA